MKRKILHNRKNTFTGYSKGKIGTPLPIVDKEGNVLKVGDTVKYFQQIGIIFTIQIMDETENMVW